GRAGPLRLLATPASAPGLDCAERAKWEENHAGRGGRGGRVPGGQPGRPAPGRGWRARGGGRPLARGRWRAGAAERRRAVRFHRMDVAQGGLATLADRVRADAWVHLATAIDPVRAWEDPTGGARAGVPGAVEVLRAAAATGARAVLVSSGAYLYPAQLTGLTRAGDVPRPVHPFGAARLAMEAHAGAFTARGLEVATLVLGTVYGPRQDPLGPGLVARAAWTMLQGQPPRGGGGGAQGRDFLFVDDAVDAVARAVHASPAPGRVLVGTGTATAVLDVVEQLAALVCWAGEPKWAPARPGDPRRSALD